MALPKTQKGMSLRSSVYSVVIQKGGYSKSKKGKFSTEPDIMQQRSHAIESIRFFAKLVF